ncbi:MAG TPA: hypothetical protein PKV97_07420 [Thauera aminoaromatica]|nr:hypothetical protein [Thauera aminoaromatica]HND57399.1 hypothetical protein [Thauera aminoaromatica]HON29437.1 hypothetical protein [Ottowia sp.]
MQLPMIPQDKANHAIYGGAIALVAAAIAHVAGAREWQAQIALGAACAAGVAKEVADYIVARRQRANGDAVTHGVDGWDAAVTALGGMAVAIGVWL